MGIPILDYLAKQATRRPVRDVLSDTSVVSERGPDVRINRPYTGLGLLECGSLENKGWLYAKQILSIGGVVDTPPPRAALPMVQSRLVNFSSTDLLGLAGHHDTVRAAREALERFGLSSGGPGRIDPVLNMEDEFARFMGHKAAVSRGSFADLCTDLFGALVDDRDTVYLWHGCDQRLARGARACGAQTVDFSPRADLPDPDEDGNRGRFSVVVASAFDRARLAVRDLTGCAAFAAERNALLIVDETGCLGVLGDWGRGAADAQGLGDQVPVVVAETGFGLPGCGGGLMTGNRDVADAVRSRAGGASGPGFAPTAAAGLAQALILLAREPDRRTRLGDNVAALERMCEAAGVPTRPGNYPVVRVAVEADELAAAFGEAAGAEDVLLPQPHCPGNEPVLPIFATADHTDEHLGKMAAVLEAVAGRGGRVRPERT